MTSRVTFRLIGSFGVVRDGQVLADADVGSRKARTLLKLLVVERGRQVPTDRIVELLWNGRPPSQPAGNVATLASRLRASLGQEVIRGNLSRYGLGEPYEHAVDVDEASALVREAEDRYASAPALALAGAQRALDVLGSGRALEDEPYADWAGPARAEAAVMLRRARQVGGDAALACGEAGVARRLAEEAISADELDEPAYRTLMAAHQLAGGPAGALVAFERLREALVKELGADPAPSTRALHAAILREQPPAPAAPAQPVVAASTLVGRAHETGRLAERWSAAASGSSALLLIAGQAGIGKTRLAEEAARLARTTGGIVLQARCYDTERSLFLQPVVEALRGYIATAQPARLREVAGEWASPLAALLPEMSELLHASPLQRVTPQPGASLRDDIERRRLFDAVAAFLRRLSERQPVLLLLDDLHNAGLSTVELLHYLARQTPGGRLLCLATLRDDEGAEPLAALAAVSERIDVGPLAAAAVAELAAAAGRPDLAQHVQRLTGGHALFVVETLRGMVAGEEGIPASLQAAILARVRRAGAEAEELLRAAAVLGPPFEPATLAAVLDLTPTRAARRCEDALRSRLVVVSGQAYEFTNDLVQEVLYATTPEPTRVQHHRVAASQLVDRPEAMAGHAAATGDWARAARAWLLSGEHALQRYAGSDAQALLDRALDAAERAEDVEIQARAHLVRSQARERLGACDDAWTDGEAAMALARQAGDRRLEMLALRTLGGELSTALCRTVEYAGYLEAGARIAQTLGDRASESELLGWLAVVATNRLQFDRAVEHGRGAVAAARASGSDRAVAAALDGLKTVYAYLGDVDSLETVLAELDPLLRRQGDLWLLQWAVFESAFPAVARADWNEAVVRTDEALALNRRTGPPSYEAAFLAHRAWIDRLRGRLDDALRGGRGAAAAAARNPHPWWIATANAFLGATLLETGAAREAASLLEDGLAAVEHSGAEAYRLRCLGPLAEATGRREVLVEADELLRRVGAPAGTAWLTGSDAYLAIARAWLAQHQPERAQGALAPMLHAAERFGWVVALAQGSLVAGRCAAARGDRDGARDLFLRAWNVAGRHGLASVEHDAQQALGV